MCKGAVPATWWICASLSAFCRQVAHRSSTPSARRARVREQPAVKETGTASGLRRRDVPPLGAHVVCANARQGPISTRGSPSAAAAAPRRDLLVVLLFFSHHLWTSSNLSKSCCTVEGHPRVAFHAHWRHIRCQCSSGHGSAAMRQSQWTIPPDQSLAVQTRICSCATLEHCACERGGNGCCRCIHIAADG